MKESFEVVFLNEFDINIFDEYFYKNLLNSIVNLLKKKSTKVENEIMTCACHRQVEGKSFGRRSVNENSF